MAEQKIEDFVGVIRNGEIQKNAHKFISYLATSNMNFEKVGGYWEDKYYWSVNYKEKSVCYILLDKNCWTVWSDDSGENSFENFLTDEYTKEIAWCNLIICEKTERCFEGCARGRKIFFGREFDNVCGTAMKFVNPNAETVDCIIKIMEIRKGDISQMAGGEQG